MAKKDTAVTLDIDDDAIAARAAQVAKETDDQIVERLKDRFQILTDMTKAVKSGDVRALIVSGPPGVGKSFGVEEILHRQDLFTKLTAQKPKFEIVKGTTSAIGLYVKLYEYSEKGNVIVFDDCDSILTDDIALNILKGALDSSERRFISWNTDSRVLRNEGVPNSFEFKGTVIFITNIKFDTVRSKRLRGHLAALESRCHYIDLQMDTDREKMLRIRQIVDEGMLRNRKFTDEEVDEIMEFIETNKPDLNELSLRMVDKLSNLMRAFPSNWRKIAQTTCMKRR